MTCKRRKSRERENSRERRTGCLNSSGSVCHQCLFKKRGEKALKGIKKKVQKKLPDIPARELYNQALMADRMWWKLVGGLRTTAGKMWDVWRQARGRPGRQMATAEDYFKSSFFAWYHDPIQFAKKKPREADSLKAIWKEFTEGL